MAKVEDLYVSFYPVVTQETGNVGNIPTLMAHVAKAACPWCQGIEGYIYIHIFEIV